MSAKRFGIEAGVIVVLLLAIVGVWFFKDHQMVQQAEAAEQRADTLVVRAEEWASQIVTSEAATVGRAFAAGISPMVLADRRDELDPAVVSLLTLKSIAFVHILDGEGNVLASSDRKYIAAGNVADEATWALDSVVLMTRPSERSGILEVATPVLGVSAANRAYLWMGYKVAERMQMTRPQGLPGVGETAAEGEANATPATLPAAGQPEGDDGGEAPSGGPEAV